MDEEKRLKQLFLLIPEVLFWAWIEWSSHPTVKNGLGQFGAGSGPGSGIGQIISYDSPIMLWHIPFPYITVSWEFPWICLICLFIFLLFVDLDTLE